MHKTLDITFTCSQEELDDPLASLSSSAPKQTTGKSTLVQPRKKIASRPTTEMRASQYASPRRYRQLYILSSCPDTTLLRVQSHMYSQRHPAATSQLEMFLNPDQFNKETIFRLTRAVRVILSQLH